MTKINPPIIMYHSVSDNCGWLWGHLACPVRVFEEHVRVLADRGFTAISLQDLYNYRRHGAALPLKPVILTFDDGYLDNWVYVFPILKRYGFKGTIFVNPEFVDPADKLRPNLDDVATGKLAASALEAIGYLSWAEMLTMEESGVIDIQSHTMTHTWHFTDNRIVDFHHPGDQYPWLAWNARPECKYSWLSEDQSSFAPFGTPIYTHDKALTAHQYFPDARLTDFVVEQVVSWGGGNFFQQKDWQDILLQLTSQYQSKHQLIERWESEEEYEARVQYELGMSKEIIEAKLRKQVSFLCWPGGGYNHITERIAKEVGYLSMTLSSRDPRRFGANPDYLTRLGAPLLQWHDKTLYQGGHYLVHLLNCQRGVTLSCLIYKLLGRYNKLRFWGDTIFRSSLN